MVRLTFPFITMMEYKKIEKKKRRKIVPNTVLRFLARMLSFLGLRFPNEKSNELNEML